MSILVRVPGLPDERFDSLGMAADYIEGPVCAEYERRIKYAEMAAADLRDGELVGAENCLDSTQIELVWVRNKSGVRQK
jgi:hypothetical protein